MLTGRRPFEGRDVSEVLAGVIRAEPQWDVLADTPPHLNMLLKRCLEKEPRQRLQAAGDVRLALDGAFETPAAPPSEPMAVQAVPQAKLLWVGAVVLSAIVAGVAGWNLKPGVLPATAVNRFSHVLTADERITDRNRQVVAFAPDGSSLVYAANEQLYLRMMSGLESHPIPGTDEEAEGPFFSPDSQWIAYFSITDL